MPAAGNAIQTFIPEDQMDISQFRTEQRVPPPGYRHAAPSAPWPWIDFDKDDVDVVPLTPGLYEPWMRYPQSHFGNWTKDQVERCRMLTICGEQSTCYIHKVDVFEDGSFDNFGKESAQSRQIHLDAASEVQFWDEIAVALDSDLRVRVLFVENITLAVLQILGSRFDIEPFFFASSANWIPSRYQENPHTGEGDHITIVLPFIRAVNNQQERGSPIPLFETQYVSEKVPDKASALMTDKNHTIDTQAPLVLSPQRILLHDLLAIHMVRSTTENVIISYHHNLELQKSTARRLRSLVQQTADSVYWSKLYDRSNDPTFVFLVILWYALYAWDEALEAVYEHLSEKLEGSFQEVGDITTRMLHTRELHKLQAHLLNYQQLLRDFYKSVEFVRDTPNPAMDGDPGQTDSMRLLQSESDVLLSEIERLEKQRQIQSDRLENAICLSFSTIHIEKSRSMQDLTRATSQSSSSLKQISYLTIVFLPATFLSGVFKMNVAEINPGTPETLAVYVESSVILTVITAWVVIALHSHSSFHPGGNHIVKRIAWPILWIVRLMAGTKEIFFAWWAVYNHRGH